MLTKRIIFLNQKGGVGKTTSAANVGSFLAEMGYKVLLIDLDSQGNLSVSVSVDVNKAGIYDVIAGEAGVAAIQDTPVMNLSCLSGGLNMAGLSLELVDEKEREFFLKKAMKPIDENYDFVIADCPPGLDLVTMNALVWADYIMIPMQCEYFAMEGLNLLMRTVANIRHKLNPDLKILGIFFTMYSSRAKLHREVVDDITSYFSKEVFNTKIPRNVRLSEAPSHGLPINIYDNRCAGAVGYKNLAKEVLERVNK